MIVDLNKPVKAKRYYLGKGIAVLIAVIIFIVIPFIFSNIDEIGRIFCFFLAGLLFFIAIYNFRQYKKSHPDSKVYENIAAAPANLQVKYFKKIMFLSYVAFPAMSAFTAWELNNLESGNAETVQLWFPLGLIYGHMGYWPAVLSPICLGIICVVIFNWKITKVSQELKTNNP